LTLSIDLSLTASPLRRTRENVGPYSSCIICGMCHNLFHLIAKAIRDVDAFPDFVLPWQRLAKNNLMTRLSSRWKCYIHAFIVS
jgi:hypothetical protein